MEYDIKNDCYCALAPLPGSVRACCTINGFDRIVLVNETLTDEARMNAYAHELDHLERGDLFSEAPAAELEAK